MNLLTQNSKLKKTSKELGIRVFNFGIPAYKSSSLPYLYNYATLKKVLTYGLMLNQRLKSVMS